MSIPHFYYCIKPCYICILMVHVVVFASSLDDAPELENAYRWAIGGIKEMEQLPYRRNARKAEAFALETEG